MRDWYSICFMKQPREYKRLCSKCGLRHVKPTGLKCHRHNITTCNVTMFSPIENVSEIPGSTSHGMATTTVATTTTTTTSVCCRAPTMTTTVSSAGSSTTMSSSISAASNVGSTLQTLVAVISFMSARLDAMESAINAQAAAPPVARPPPVPAPPVPAPLVTVPSLSLQPGIAPAPSPAPNMHRLSPPHVPASQHQPPPPTPALPQLLQQHGHIFQAANQGSSSQAIAARVGRELAVPEGSSSDSDDPHPQSTRKSNSKKLKSGHSRTSEDVVKRQVDWPNFNVFKGAAMLSSRIWLTDDSRVYVRLLGQSAQVWRVPSYSASHVETSPWTYAWRHHVPMGRRPQLPWHSSEAYGARRSVMDW